MLAPHELKKRDFTKSLRGYSTEEVDEHISFIIEKYTELYRENDALEKKLHLTEAQLDSVKQEEDSIRSALVNAQKASKTIIDEANEQADVIMRSAKTNCDRMIRELRETVTQEEEKLEMIKAEVNAFKAALYSVYTEHIGMIEAISPQTVDVETSRERVEELTSSVVSRIRKDLEKINPVITGKEAPFETEEPGDDEEDESTPAEIIIPDKIDEPVKPRVAAVRDADQLVFDDIDGAVVPTGKTSAEDAPAAEGKARNDSIVETIKKLNNEVNKNSRDDDEEFLKLLRMASGNGEMTSTEAFEIAYDGNRKD